MQLTRARRFSAAAILLLLAGVQAQYSVTIPSQSLCALPGATVRIPCGIRRPHYPRVTHSEWYRVTEEEPEDLSKDPRYSGRVSVGSQTSACELTIRNVGPSDSGVYNFRFKPEIRDWVTAPSGVHLNITAFPDLKVLVTARRSWYKNLRCVATCTVPDTLTYTWYKNGQPFPNTGEEDLHLDFTILSSGSYSCAVRGFEDRRSPAVCHFDQNKCWSVTYSAQTICALIGSSVDLHSYYTFPTYYKVTKAFWFVREQNNGEGVDMREDEAEYRGRVQYTHNSQNNCSLRISNLRDTDARGYRFDIGAGRFTAYPGVVLSVTGLKVNVSDCGDRDRTLSCITSCALSNKPAYVWYENGRRVSECNASSCSVAQGGGDAVTYICSVDGLRSPPVYSPTNTRAEVLPFGDAPEGGSVTLRCSSDANPPVLTYTWTKRGAPHPLLATGQNYSIANIGSMHSGLYFCTAHNLLGHHDSTPVHLDVLYAPRNTSMSVEPGDRPTVSCSSDWNPPGTYTWYRKTQEGVTPIGKGPDFTLPSGSLSGSYYCTAVNPLGSSNSSGWAYTAEGRVATYTASGVTVASLLIFCSISLWICRRRASGSSSEENAQNNSPPVYGNVSDVTQTASSELQYLSVFFRHSETQDAPLYSTVRPPNTRRQNEEVEYAAVNFASSCDVREEEIYKNLKYKK